MNPVIPSFHADSSLSRTSHRGMRRNGCAIFEDCPLVSLYENLCGPLLAHSVGTLTISFNCGPDGRIEIGGSYEIFQAGEPHGFP